MKNENGLEQKVKLDFDFVKCPYIKCNTYGEFIYCYFTTFENCETYERWQADIELYVKKCLVRQYLKRKRKK